MCKGIRFVGVAVLALLMAAASMADLSKGLKGRVLDREGKPIVGATILIQDKTSEAMKWETKTDEKGYWIYGGLSTNQDGYRVTLKAEGIPDIIKEAKVKVFDQVTVDFDLRKDLQLKEDKPAKASPIEEAISLFKLEDYEGALGKADESILQNDTPNNLKAAKKIKAVCLLRLGRVDEALDALEAYNTLYPGEVDILGELANCYAKKGDKAKADQYKKLFKEKGGKIEGDTYNQGVAAFNEGDMPKAIASFQASIAENPKEADAHRELAKCYAQTGKYSKAVEELKTYLKMKPDAEDKAMWEQAIPGLQKLKDTN